MSPPAEPVISVLARLERVKRSGTGWTARCPAHDDHKNSLSISEGHDGRVLLYCHASCSTSAVCDALGLLLADLFPRQPTKGQTVPRRIESLYTYTDEMGNVLFQTVRYDPKDFGQRRPDGQGGWIYNLSDVRRVLYGLPEIATSGEHEAIWIVEGEKDADRLRSLGLLATTSPLGAGKWRDEYAKQIGGRPVAIIPDNDVSGRKHKDQIAASCAANGSAVRIVQLPDLADKGDVSDWLDSGGTREHLEQLMQGAPAWCPSDESTAAPSPSEQAPPPFPMHALPPLARAFVEIGAAARGVPPEFVAVPLLAFVGAAAGDRYRIEQKAGMIEYPVLWVAIVGKPGTAKTPSQGYAARPIRALQARFRDAHRAAMERYDSLSVEERRSTPPPRLLSIFTNEATIEAVSDMLNRRNGLVVERDELAGWTASFDTYKKGADRTTWLASWGSSAWKVDRKGTGSAYVESPVVCIAGGVQPDRLRDLRGSIVDDGFADRFLFAIPRCPPQRYNEIHDDETLIQQLTDRFEWLSSRSEPVVVRPTEQAKRLFADFYDFNADATHLSTGLAAGWSAKAPRHLLRLALVIHLLQESDPTSSLSLDTMRAAIELTEYFRAHFALCIPLMGGNGTGPVAGDAARVMSYLRQGAGLPVSRSTLMQKTRLPANRLDEILRDLESAGTIERIVVNTGSRPREDWRIVSSTHSENSGNSEQPHDQSSEFSEFSESLASPSTEEAEEWPV